MKTPIILIAIISITLTSISQALNIQWQIDLPVEAQIRFTMAGSDGSAVALDVTNDVLYWIGPSGNMIATIPDFVNPTEGYSAFAEPIIVNSSQLGMRTWDTQIMKIVTKTESEPGYSVVNLNGEIGPVNNQPTFSFLTAHNGTQITMYKLDSTQSASRVGVAMVPMNAIVIPASNQGNVTISLESSKDLVEWTPTLTGSYSPTDESRFFRVKAVTEN